MDWRPVYAAASSNNVDLLAALETDGLSLALADPVDGGEAPAPTGRVAFLLGERSFMIHNS
jgi:hypothetical protein